MKHSGPGRGVADGDRRGPAGGSGRATDPGRIWRAIAVRLRRFHEGFLRNAMAVALAEDGGRDLALEQLGHFSPRRGSMVESGAGGADTSSTGVPLAPPSGRLTGQPRSGQAG